MSTTAEYTLKNHYIHTMLQTTYIAMTDMILGFIEIVSNLVKISSTNNMSTNRINKQLVNSDTCCHFSFSTSITVFILQMFNCSINVYQVICTIKQLFGTSNILLTMNTMITLKDTIGYITTLSVTCHIKNQVMKKILTQVTILVYKNTTVFILYKITVTIIIDKFYLFIL